VSTAAAKKTIPKTSTRSRAEISNHGCERRRVELLRRALPVRVERLRLLPLLRLRLLLLRLRLELERLLEELELRVLLRLVIAQMFSSFLCYYTMVRADPATLALW
jgi:hypothetical protein